MVKTAGPMSRSEALAFERRVKKLPRSRKPSAFDP